MARLCIVVFIVTEAILKLRQLKFCDMEYVPYSNNTAV